MNVTFAPTAAGHQAAHLVLVACATNRPAAHLWAHGGSDPAPTFASEPLFFADLAGSTFVVLPDGTRLPANNSLHSCQNGNRLGSSDLCATDRDCVAAGETCALSSTCIGGSRAAQVCSTSADCPGGFCRSSSLSSDPVDMCGDGTGGLYIMTDIEGVAGVLNSQEWTSPGHPYYALGKEFLTLEVNAAADGFFEGKIVLKATGGEEVPLRVKWNRPDS